MKQESTDSETERYLRDVKHELQRRSLLDYFSDDLRCDYERKTPIVRNEENGTREWNERDRADHTTTLRVE
jgi:hypothetical protein